MLVLVVCGSQFVTKNGEVQLDSLLINILTHYIWKENTDWQIWEQEKIFGEVDSMKSKKRSSKQVVEQK